MAGEAVEGDLAAGLADEVATIADLSDHDVRLQLVVPPVRSNTAAACAALAAAGDDADRLRRGSSPPSGPRTATSATGRSRPQSRAADRDDVIAGRWQAEFEALPQPVTPSLVLPDGYLSTGLGALARLADLVAGGRSSERPGRSADDERR